MPNIQLQFRRGVASRWSAANPVLAAGELGLETDTSKFKIGNGVTAWGSLPYGGIKGDPGEQGPSGPAFAFDGGSPSTSYVRGPSFDCGGVT
jgi:hypothetical protein